MYEVGCMSDNEERLKRFARKMFIVCCAVSQEARGDGAEVCIDRRLLHELNSAAGHLDWALRMYGDEED